jgi:hypothetical protein
MSWNKLTELPREWYNMYWLKSFKVDNNRLKVLTEDVGMMQGLRQFWFGMNELEKCVRSTAGSLGTSPSPLPNPDVECVP